MRRPISLLLHEYLPLMCKFCHFHELDMVSHVIEHLCMCLFILFTCDALFFLSGSGIAVLYRVVEACLGCMMLVSGAPGLPLTL